MQQFSGSPREMISSLWRNRELLRNLIYREVVGRYKGSMLGILWSLVTPMFMLAVYTFVFSVVFKARWNDSNTSQTDFALVLFSGLIVFNLFSECITRAPSLILSNVNYVKKVVFPLEIFPWVVLGGALFHFMVSFGVWLVAYALLIGIPHWTVVLVPLVIGLYAFFIMGLSWLLASLGVYLRDVGQLMGLVVTVLMFMSPIFYPVSALPPNLQPLLLLNPLALPIEMVRDLMYWGVVPGLGSWLLGGTVAVLVGILGFAWFQKTRRGFADVL